MSGGSGGGAPALSPSREPPVGQEQGDEPEDLAAEDQSVEIEGRLPADLLARDHERADGAGLEPEAGAAVGALSLLTATAASAALDRGCGNHRDAVSLVGLAVDPLDRDRVAGAGNRLVQVHRSTSGLFTLQIV